MKLSGFSHEDVHRLGAWADGRRGSVALRVLPKLQALVYDILLWRKVPESDARSDGTTVLLLTWEYM